MSIGCGTAVSAALWDPSGISISSIVQLLLEAEDFDRDDRDSLVAQHAFGNLDFSGDGSVLHHLGHPEILHPGNRRGRQGGLNRVEQRVENRRRCDIGIARMGIDVKLHAQHPHGRRAERRDSCFFKLLSHEQRRLLRRGEIAPVPQLSSGSDKIRGGCDPLEQRRVYWFPTDHSTAAISVGSVAVGATCRNGETGVTSRYCDSSSLTCSLISRCE